MKRDQVEDVPDNSSPKKVRQDFIDPDQILAELEDLLPSIEVLESQAGESELVESHVVENEESEVEENEENEAESDLEADEIEENEAVGNDEVSSDLGDVREEQDSEEDFEEESQESQESFEEEGEDNFEGEGEENFEGENDQSNAEGNVKEENNQLKEEEIINVQYDSSDDFEHVSDDENTKTTASIASFDQLYQNETNNDAVFQSNHPDLPDDLIETEEFEESFVLDLVGEKGILFVNLKGPLLAVIELRGLGWTPSEVLEDLRVDVDADFLTFDQKIQWEMVDSFIMKHFYSRPTQIIAYPHEFKELLGNAKNIVVVSGAGVSTSCGIPDFRSSNGIYKRLKEEYGMATPESMFDLSFFTDNPKPFFSFAREIYPGCIAPSSCHFFLKFLESKGKLLRNYTQNIDTLECVAGIDKVFQCHGSFATATCLECKSKFSGDAIKEAIMAQEIPICTSCLVGIVKPDIVFFGEPLPPEFDTLLAHDAAHADLLIVIGSSLKVYPVAHILDVIPPHVPQILINKESLKHREFDLELLGSCDDIVEGICDLMEWRNECDWLDKEKPVEKGQKFVDGIWVWPDGIVPVLSEGEAEEHVVASDGLLSLDDDDLCT